MVKKDGVRTSSHSHLVALGLGENSFGMTNMNEYMVFKGRQVLFNEYYSNSMMGQPILYAKPHMTAFNAVPAGRGFRIRFTRDLIANHEGYFDLKDEIIKIVVAINNQDIPVDPETWVTHNRVQKKEVNLFKEYKECKSN